MYKKALIKNTVLNAYTAYSKLKSSKDTLKSADEESKDNKKA